MSGYPKFSILRLARPVIAISLDTRRLVALIFTCDPLASTGPSAPPLGPSIALSITKALSTKTLRMHSVNCGVHPFLCCLGICVHFCSWGLGMDAEYLGSGVNVSIPLPLHSPRTQIGSDFYFLTSRLIRDFGGISSRKCLIISGHSSWQCSR